MNFDNLNALKITKNFKKLIEIDKTGEAIYNAGERWETYKDGYIKPTLSNQQLLNALILKDTTGEWLYKTYTSSNRIIHDHLKWFTAIINTDTTGEWIYKTTQYIPNKYKKTRIFIKAFIKIIMVNKTGKWIKKFKNQWYILTDEQYTYLLKKYNKPIYIKYKINKTI